MNESEEVDEGKVTLTQVEILEDGSMQESIHYTGHWVGDIKRQWHELVELKGDVRFLMLFLVTMKHIDFKDITILHNGTKIAFVGSTGLGKQRSLN